jgi:2-dehydropantoate 2-reductase
MTRWAVLGPGGVGGFLAAALVRAGHEVSVIARPGTATAIEAGGLRIHSVELGDFTARPAVATELVEPVDVLVVATKATGLQPALDRVRVEPRLVVPLLNGLEHVALLRARFGAARVAAATIRIESDRPQAGVIVQSSPSVRIELAHDDLGVRPSLENIAAGLTEAGMPAILGPSEAQVLWSKLVRLGALALTTSACNESIGFIRTDPDWRSDLVACVRETAAVAAADGAAIDPADTVAELDAAHPELGSSLQRDIAAGRPNELDAIAGAVLRAASRHGLECPTVERLAAIVAYRASEHATVAAGAPSIEHVMAGVAVSDYQRSLPWYRRLFGRPADVAVAEEESMWRLSDTAWLYVVGDPERSGASLVTILVDDLDEQVAELERRGIAAGPVETVPGSHRKTLVTDPDGNRIQFGQALRPEE